MAKDLDSSISVKHCDSQVKAFNVWRDRLIPCSGELAAVGSIITSFKSREIGIEEFQERLVQYDFGRILWRRIDLAFVNSDMYKRCNAEYKRLQEFLGVGYFSSDYESGDELRGDAPVYVPGRYDHVLLCHTFVLSYISEILYVVIEEYKANVLRGSLGAKADVDKGNVGVSAKLKFK